MNTQPEEINNSSQLEITREIRSNSGWIRLTFDDRPLLAQSISKDLDLVADFNREWESARAQYYASARDRTVIQSSRCEVTKCPICLESVDALKRSGVVLIITVYGHIICRPDLNEIIKNVWNVGPDNQVPRVPFALKQIWSLRSTQYVYLKWKEC